MRRVRRPCWAGLSYGQSGSPSLQATPVTKDQTLKHLKALFIPGEAGQVQVPTRSHPGWCLPRTLSPPSPTSDASPNQTWHRQFILPTKPAIMFYILLQMLEVWISLYQSLSELGGINMERSPSISRTLPIESLPVHLHICTFKNAFFDLLSGHFYTSISTLSFARVQGSIVAPIFPWKIMDDHYNQILLVQWIILMNLILHLDTDVLAQSGAENIIFSTLSILSSGSQHSEFQFPPVDNWFIGGFDGGWTQAQI